jgi:hypothetical protein
MQGALQALDGNQNMGYILKKDPLEEMKLREQQK